MKLIHRILANYYSELIDSLEPNQKGLYLKYWLKYDRHKRKAV